MRASGMDNTRDIRASRGVRLACSTVATRENGMIVVYRLDDQSHSHPLIRIQSDPLSRRFRVFLISRLELFAKVHAPEARRHARAMTTTDVREQLDFAIDLVQLLHGDVDFGQGLT